MSGLDISKRTVYTDGLPKDLNIDTGWVEKCNSLVLDIGNSYVVLKNGYHGGIYAASSKFPVHKVHSMNGFMKMVQGVCTSYCDSVVLLTHAFFNEIPTSIKNLVDDVAK